MEPRYQHTINGQSVIQRDFNAMGDAGALADDRVLHELVRLAAYNGSSPARGIAPYYTDDLGELGLVEANGGTGSVLVYPFRAFVGSRTAAATDGKKNWRDMRSGVAAGSTTLAQTVALSANASGNPRWDLIYAAITPDATLYSEARKVKSPTSNLITTQTAITQTYTPVSLGVVEGTAAASPDWPSAPTDASGVFYVPLAYVRVPNGFGASSTVAPTDIAAAREKSTPLR